MSAVPTSWENDNLIGAQRNDTEGHQNKNKSPNLSEEGRQTSKETNNHETSRTVLLGDGKDDQTKRNSDKYDHIVVTDVAQKESSSLYRRE